MAMAVPRLMAGLAIEPHDGLLRAIGKGSRVELGDVLRATEDYRGALAWHATAEDSADLAALYFVAASLFPAEDILRRDFLRRAIEQDQDALQRGPAQPFVWLQLAMALINAEGDSELARQALVQSLRRAPWQPRLAQLRAGVGLRYWPQLDEESRALVLLQLRLAAEIDPRGLAAVIPTPSLWAVVEEALVDRPELLAGLEPYRGRP